MLHDLKRIGSRAEPFGLLNLVNDRFGNGFDDIDAVVSSHERKEFMARYKTAAGFARDTLNAAAPTIAPGSMVRG